MEVSFRFQWCSKIIKIVLDCVSILSIKLSNGDLSSASLCMMQSQGLHRQEADHRSIDMQGILPWEWSLAIPQKKFIGRYLLLSMRKGELVGWIPILNHLLDCKQSSNKSLILLRELPVSFYIVLSNFKGVIFIILNIAAFVIIIARIIIHRRKTPGILS